MREENKAILNVLFTLQEYLYRIRESLLDELQNKLQNVVDAHITEWDTTPLARDVCE